VRLSVYGKMMKQNLCWSGLHALKNLEIYIKATNHMVSSIYDYMSWILVVLTLYFILLLESFRIKILFCVDPLVKGQGFKAPVIDIDMSSYSAGSCAEHREPLLRIRGSLREFGKIKKYL
jgi:hypothetical protein